MQVHITANIQGPSGPDLEVFSSHDVKDRDMWIRAINVLPVTDSDGIISVVIESTDAHEQSQVDVPLSYPRADLVTLADLLIQDVAGHEYHSESFKPAHTRSLFESHVTGEGKETFPLDPQPKMLG